MCVAIFYRVYVRYTLYPPPHTLLSANLFSANGVSLDKSLTGDLLKTHRSLIRRLCFALVTARTLAFAVAPILDRQVLPAGGQQVAVQPAQDADNTGLPQHDPSTCAICALLHDTPWTPAATPEPRADIVVFGETFELRSVATPAAPQRGFRSRAPPAFG